MRKAIALALGTGALLLSSQAFAAFHQMLIVEVHTGPDAYVMLQMTAAGQNQTGGHALIYYDSEGDEVGRVNLQNVPNGAKDSNILIGTNQVQASFNVAPDFATLPALDPEGGMVCFDTTFIDCFAWGNYEGDVNGAEVGFPYQWGDTDRAARRSSVLEADDTNDSEDDFAEEDPAPKRNGFNGSTNDGGTTPSPSPTSPGSSGTPTTPGDDDDDDDGETPAATAKDDGGCNTSGAGDYVAAPLLGLCVMGVLGRLRRRRR